MQTSVVRHSRNQMLRSTRHFFIANGVNDNTCTGVNRWHSSVLRRSDHRGPLLTTFYEQTTCAFRDCVFCNLADQVPSVLFDDDCTCLILGFNNRLPKLPVGLLNFKTTPPYITAVPLQRDFHCVQLHLQFLTHQQQFLFRFATYAFDNNAACLPIFASLPGFSPYQARVASSVWFTGLIRSCGNSILFRTLTLYFR